LLSGTGLGVTKVGENRLRGEALRADASSWVPVGSATMGGSATDVSVVDGGRQQEGSAEHLDPMHALLHVLVVDDDEAIRKACCKIAAGMGFAVVGADSATEARAILKHQRIDLLLLDLKLPGGGGLPLLEQVKTLHPDTAVIVMTAFATVSSAV